MTILTPHGKIASRRGDAIALTLSGACLMHCLVLPFAAVLFPVFASAAQAEWVHFVLVALALPISIYALTKATHDERLTWMLRAGAALGLLLLLLGALGWPEHEWETPLTVSGALVLMGVHWTNFKNRPHREGH